MKTFHSGLFGLVFACLFFVFSGCFHKGPTGPDQPKDPIPTGQIKRTSVNGNFEVYLNIDTTLTLRKSKVSKIDVFTIKQQAKERVSGLNWSASLMHLATGQLADSSPIVMADTNGTYNINNIVAKFIGSWEIILTLAEPVDTVRFLLAALPSGIKKTSSGGNYDIYVEGTDSAVVGGTTYSYPATVVSAGTNTPVSDPNWTATMYHPIHGHFSPKIPYVSLVNYGNYTINDIMAIPKMSGDWILTLIHEQPADTVSYTIVEK